MVLNLSLHWASPIQSHFCIFFLLLQKDLCVFPRGGVCGTPTLVVERIWGNTFRISHRMIFLLWSGSHPVCRAHYRSDPLGHEGIHSILTTFALIMGVLKLSTTRRKLAGSTWAFKLLNIILRLSLLWIVPNMFSSMLESPSSVPSAKIFSFLLPSAHSGTLPETSTRTLLLQFSLLLSFVFTSTPKVKIV